MKKIIFSLIIIAGLCYCTKSHAQIYIKAFGSTGNGSATGVFDGGSQSEGHHNEIEAYAYSDGLVGCATASAGKGGGAGACKVVKSPFTFSMPVSFAVISFKYNLLLGKLLTYVDMNIEKQGEGSNFAYYKVHMEGVQVVSISEGAGSPDSPVFNIELQPTKIAWQVNKQSNDGGSGPGFSYGWDFSANKPFIYSF